MVESAGRRQRVKLNRRPKAPSPFIAGRSTGVDTPLVPLQGRGPSVDQPAPGSRRHIPSGSPEPPLLVKAVTILEQSPTIERWERIGADLWVHLGSLADDLHRDDLDGRVVPWSRVGLCHHGTQHDLKDITDRMPEWQDRPIDGLPERPHVVYLRVDGGHPGAMTALRSVCRDVEVSTALDVLRFERFAPTMSAAVRSVTADAEFAGFLVTGIQAG